MTFTCFMIPHAHYFELQKPDICPPTKPPITKIQTPQGSPKPKTNTALSKTQKKTQSSPKPNTQPPLKTLTKTQNKHSAHQNPKHSALQNPKHRALQNPKHSALQNPEPSAFQNPEPKTHPTNFIINL